jgi:ketosteroid isomerase-like protein
MHRRQVLNALAGAAAAAAAGNSAAQPLSAAEMIIELDRQLNQSILTHDVRAASLLYDEDFVLTVSGGAQKRKADMLADIGNPAVSLSVCDTTDVRVRVRPSAAVLTGMLRQAGTVNGRALDVKLNVTDTWVKVEGKWLLLAGHASLAR